MIQFFHTILYQPILNLLVFFYNIIPGHDIGLAIIAITIIIKLILYPLSLQSLRSQKALQEIQPKLEALKKKYAQSKEKMARAMMELYKENKVNPMSSCLPLIIQLPILIAVFQVFRTGLTAEHLELYSFIHNPGMLNPVCFSILNLAKPSIPLAVITGILQYFQTKMLTAKKPPQQVAKSPGAKDESMMTIMNKQMQFMMPILTVVIGMTLPSGLMLYWLVSLLLTLVEQFYSFRKPKSESKSYAT